MEALSRKVGEKAVFRLPFGRTELHAEGSEIPKSSELMKLELRGS